MDILPVPGAVTERRCGHFAGFSVFRCLRTIVPAVQKILQRGQRLPAGVGRFVYMAVFFCKKTEKKLFFCLSVKYF